MANYVLDYTIHHYEDGKVGARLNVRAIENVADNEHDAIRGLLNNVAMLVEAGALDATGVPGPEIAARKQRLVAERYSGPGEPSSTPWDEMPASPVQQPTAN